MATLVLVGTTLGLVGCGDAEPTAERSGVAPQASAAPAPAHRAGVPAPPPDPGATARSGTLVLVAGGDVNLGRKVGQRLLAEPHHDPLRGVGALLADADVAFVNLESVLSDHSQETQHPEEQMVFKGTSAGAHALARAGVDVVSFANNHVWDYQAVGLDQTLSLLDRAKVLAAGASREAGRRHQAAVIERNGVTLSVLAVTASLNVGDLETHVAGDFVDRADLSAVVPAIEREKALGRRVVVSFHGGKEYAVTPDVEVLGFARAVLRAGADAFIGHHPHVPQGVTWEAGRPAFYSLGNLVFGAHRDHAWTTRGYLARLTFAGPSAPRAEACPYVIEGGEPRAIGSSDRAHPALRAELARRSNAIRPRGAEVGPPGPDGCFDVSPPRGRAVAVR